MATIVSVAPYSSGRLPPSVAALMVAPRPVTVKVRL